MSVFAGQYGGQYGGPPADPPRTDAPGPPAGPEGAPDAASDVSWWRKGRGWGLPGRSGRRPSWRRPSWRRPSWRRLNGRRLNWRRLEAAAVQGYEQDLLQRLRRLAAQSPDLLGADSHPGHGTLVLHLPDHRLVLGQVAPAVAARLVSAAPHARPALVGCGRYGRYWWVTVGDRPVLCRRILLIDHPGPGHGERPVAAPQPFDLLAVRA